MWNARDFLGIFIIRLHQLEMEKLLGVARREVTRFLR